MLPSHNNSVPAAVLQLENRNYYRPWNISQLKVDWCLSACGIAINHARSKGLQVNS